MKKKFLSVLLNTYVISGFTTIIIILFLPNYFTKYKLELQEQTYITKKNRVYFPDLNNNNLSEKIILSKGSGAYSSFIIHDDKDNMVDQWTFLEHFFTGNDFLWFLDTDNDSYNEIYAVTQKADSVFLNIMKPYSPNGVNTEIKTLFIDTIKEYNNTLNCGAHDAELSRHKINGVREVLFTLNRGFGGAPRNVYKYNSSTHEIKKSEHLTNVSYIVAQADINNDGFDEIMFKHHSHGNQIDSVHTTRSDESLWLTVLDYKLNFLFDPIEIKVPYSRLIVQSYAQDDTIKLVALLNSNQREISKPKLLIYSNSGTLIKEKELTKGWYQLYKNSKKNGFLLFNTENGELKKLDLGFEEQSTIVLKPNSEVFEIDINQDGKNEWLNIPLDKSKFTIYQEDFKEGQSFEFPYSDSKKIHYGIKQTAQGNQLYIQNEDYYYIFNYYENPYFFIRFLKYPLIYVLVLSFVFLILKGQKIRTDKNLAIEKEITELQLKTIKNNVDPHFVFNAINTISGLMLTDRKLEADEFICNFSELMRTTLQNSDSVFSSLQEEIEYVKTYMQLQQVRFNQQFKYQLKIAKSIDINSNVPKHILYTYIENAIKHGINSKHDLLIKIDILKRNNKLVLTIEDNGGGFNTSKNTRANSTGNGLLIMEKIYTLYHKLYKKKITHRIKEIVDAKNVVTGVKVVVLISN